MLSEAENPPGGLKQQLRRATVARSALDVVAMVFLGSSFAFWSVAFWQILFPPALLHPLMIQVVVLALVYSLASPLLLSALVPTTPAGQLLQKTQWRTVGFAAIIAAAVYLTWQGNKLIELWLLAQPGIAETQIARTLAISLSIAFVLVPALAWTQLTPERWLAQIQQAHQVRKLELQQAGEIAIIKARLLWAEQRAAMSYANMLPQEQQEIRDTLQGLLMGIADTQRGIARTLGISAELERVYPTLEDGEIADTMAYIAGKLDLPAQQIVEAVEESRLYDGGSHGDSRPQSSIPRTTTHTTAREPAVAHVDSRPQSSMPDSDESGRVRQSQAETDSVDVAIMRDLPPIFTANDLMTLMRWTDKRSAQRTIALWLRQNQITEVRLGRYSVTEREVRP